MTSSFGSYAQIYDAFYVDKDYQRECLNLIKLAKEFSKHLELGLEIGAGSGSLTKELTKYLNHIEVFELSQSMTDVCKANLASYKNVNVHQGGLQKALDSNIKRKSLDIVIANFHVFTYFSDAEVILFIEICSKFLRTGGLVVFDFWDLDAVKNTPPASTIKVARYEGREITRETFPVSKNEYRKVEVNFDFYEGLNILFSECHDMYPRSLGEVKKVFEDGFEFCGSFDIYSGENYARTSYGNLVYFKKN
jgi:SAM-dependent methyltransferase